MPIIDYEKLSNTFRILQRIFITGKWKIIQKQTFWLKALKDPIYTSLFIVTKVFEFFRNPVYNLWICINST